MISRLHTPAVLAFSGKRRCHTAKPASAAPGATRRMASPCQCLDSGYDGSTAIYAHLASAGLNDRRVAQRRRSAELGQLRDHRCALRRLCRALHPGRRWPQWQPWRRYQPDYRGVRGGLWTPEAGHGPDREICAISARDDRPRTHGGRVRLRRADHAGSHAGQRDAAARRESGEASDHAASEAAARAPTSSAWRCVRLCLVADASSWRCLTRRGDAGYDDITLLTKRPAGPRWAVSSRPRFVGRGGYIDSAALIGYDEVADSQVFRVSTARGPGDYSPSRAARRLDGDGAAC